MKKKFRKQSLDLRKTLDKINVDDCITKYFLNLVSSTEIGSIISLSKTIKLSDIFMHKFFFISSYLSFNLVLATVLNSIKYNH